MVEWLERTVLMMHINHQGTDTPTGDASFSQKPGLGWQVQLSQWEPLPTLQQHYQAATAAGAV